MIREHYATQASIGAQAWVTAVCGAALSAAGALLRGLRSAVSSWRSEPVLPYAALWEANVMVSFLDDSHQNPER